MKRILQLTITLTVMFCIVSSGYAANWPGFLGSNRDGHSADTGLLKQWPADGPPLLWKVDNIGPGWSSMAVVDGLIYTTGNSGEKMYLICLDTKGKEKWRVAQGPMCSHKKYSGARSTPQIDGDRLYVTGGEGLVTCHKISDGSVIWKKDMKTDMGGKVGGWLYAESVLILGKLAIITPGGSNPVVALDKMTGKVVWESDKMAQAGYSSCIPITESGSTIIVNGSQSGILMIDAKTGKEIYRHPFAVKNTANCPTLIYVDGKLFWAVGYGKGAVCLDVSCKGGKWSFTEAWTNKDLNCHPGNYVVVDGSIYGKGKGGFACVDLKSGATKWKDKIGSGQACYADGMIYSFADRGGKISLVDPNASADRVKGSFTVAGTGASWSHPVIVDGRLYLRYDTNLYCYNVKK